MSNFIMILRIIFGVILFIYGINGFLNFIPNFGVNSNFSIEQENLIRALQATIFFFPFFYVFQIIAGILVVMNLFFPLVILILFPITINIFLFYYFLGVNRDLFNREMILPLFLIFVHFFFLVLNLGKYRSLFFSKDDPSDSLS